MMAVRPVGEVMGGAMWIDAPFDAPVNRYAVFYCAFVSMWDDVRLRVSADAQYAVWMDGVLSATGQYDDYPDARAFDEWVLPLSGGAHALAVATYCPVTDSSVYRAGTPGVAFSVLDAAGHALVASRTGMRCGPHPRYRSGEVERVTGQLGYSFRYDARGACGRALKAVPAAAQPLVYPRPVPRCGTGAPLAGALYAFGAYAGSRAPGETPAEFIQRAFMAARPLPPERERLALAHGDGDGMYAVYDLGRETVGYLTLDIEAEDGTEVLIGWGEHLDDLRVRTFVGGRHFAARYVCRAGRQTFTHWFQRAGLRYVQLLIGARRVRVRLCGVTPVDYPFAQATPVLALSEMEKQIDATSLHTLRLCAHTHYEDCPWREQALYAMDSRNQMRFGYAAFGETRLPLASLCLLARGLRADGLLELCAPARVPVTIPCFSLIFVLAVSEYLDASGDRAGTVALLPAARAVTEAVLSRVGEDALVRRFEGREYWNFYEWSEGLEGTLGAAEDARVQDAPLNLFFVLALRALARVCEALGEPGAKAYQAHAARVLGAVRARFYDPRRAVCFSFAAPEGEARHMAELTQALYITAMGENAEPDACRVLKDSYIRGVGGLVPVTLSHAPFVVEALAERDRACVPLIREKIAREYGGMLMAGATTYWETLEGADAFDFAGSLCHGWSAMPAWFYRHYVTARSAQPIDT